jgi:hypothetical protein
MPTRIRPEIYGEPDGITGTDCAGTMMRLDSIAIAADQPAKDQTIIIIARVDVENVFAV